MAASLHMALGSFRSQVPAFLIYRKELPLPFSN